MRTGKATIQTFATDISRKGTLPYWVSFLLHFLSNVQIVYLILQQTLDPERDIDLKVLKFIRTISACVVGFNIYQIPYPQDLFFVIWSLIIIYLIGFLSFTFYIVWIYRKGRESAHPKFLNVIGILFTLHSKFIFCPIHFFLVWVVSLTNECGTIINENDYKLHCQKQYFAMTTIACFVNFGLAIIKELFIYQIKNTDDPYTAKNNFYFQILLIHKAVITIFIMAFKDTQVLIVVFNLVLSLGYSYNLFRTLPFYDLLLLKSSFTFAAIHLVSATFVLIFSFESGQTYFEVITLLLTLMTIKVFLGIVNYRFQRIFRLQFNNPQEALHIVVLLEKYTTKYSNFSRLDDDYKEGSIKLYGLLQFYNVDAANLEGHMTIAQYNVQLYGIVLKKLIELEKRFPKSENLLLLIIDIYVKKIGNASRAISLLNQLKNNAPSLQAKAAIKEIYSNLEEIYKKTHTEQELEALRYFNYRDDANNLKDRLLLEISKQIKVWREIAAEKINVKLVVRESEEIDNIFKASRRVWNASLKTWDQNFAAPFLLYGVYLDVVRKDMLEALHVLKKYYEMRKDRRQVRKNINAFANDLAIVLASIETDKPGMIVDASSSVQTLFNIPKENLVGQKIDIVLPRFIAKSHDSFIKRYTSHCRPDLNRLTHTYARTTDGFLFPVSIRLKIYPYINNGLNIIAQIKKMAHFETILVIDPKGIVVDCSEEVFGLLNLTNRDLDTAKINDICPGFKEIDSALQFLFEEDRELLFPSGGKSHITEIDLDSEESEDQYKDDSITKDAIQIDAELRSGKRNTIALSNMSDNKNGLSPMHIELMKTVNTPNTPQSIYSGYTLDPKYTLDQKTTIDPRFGQQNTTLIFPQKKIAKDIYKRFKRGTHLQFFPKSTSQSLAHGKNSQISLKVTIEGTLLDEKLYKVIKFTELPQQNQKRTFSSKAGTSIEVKKFERMSKIEKEHANDGDEFAEKFPTDNERTEASFEQNEVEQKIVVIHHTSTPLDKIISPDENKTSTGKTHTPAPGLEGLEIKEYSRRREQRDNNTSSLKTSSHKEVRIVRALNDIFDKKTMRPITRIAVLVVYLAMMLVLSLVSLEYFFSDKSFRQMQSGVMIVNTASYRILDLVVSWEYVLVIFARARSLTTPTATSAAKAQILNATIDLINQNEDLQNRLQDSGERSLLNTFFTRNYALWVPYEGRTFDNGLVDTFIASQVIATNNFDIATYTGSVSNLVRQENVLFVLNNTANDILVKSEEQASITKQIVDDIIQTNQVLVIFLLVLEVVALVLVVIALLLVIKVISRSYMQLFRVITKINHESVTNRIAELTIIKECFLKNIEAKEFSQKVETFLDQDHRAAKKGAKAKLSSHISRHREDKFVLRELTIEALRTLILALVLLGLMAGGFFASYFLANDTFGSLQVINNRLTIAHRLGYTFDMVLGAFYYMVIFDTEPEFLWRYKNPLEEFENTLDFLSRANQMLLQSLPDPSTGEIDPILRNFLDTDVCPYLNLNTTSDINNCLSVTQSGALGLLGMNNQYYQESRIYYEAYAKDPSGLESRGLVNDYTASVRSIISVVPIAYEYLRDFLIADFNKKIEDQQMEGLLLFVMLLVGLGLTTGVIQLVTINKFRKVDIGIRKILKLVPLSMIQENRLLGFYLKNEFKKELEDIKQFV